MKSAVICHGDCDGVISAFLYIKHFLRDAYPSKTELIFTQPWRAHLDIKKVPKEISELVMLDIALSKDIISTMIPLASKAKIVVIDHHISSEEFVAELTRIGAKVIWSKATSTPKLMNETLKLNTNPYEAILIRVADICEGVEAQDELSKMADLIKLSIARDPGDTEFLHFLIRSMLRGNNIINLEEVTKRAATAKWLLNKLLKLMRDRAILVGDYLITTLTSSESRIYAGLLGIASTEFTKEMKKDAILIREEEGKVVITIRSSRKNALTLCKVIAERLGGKFGGHVEAASATLNNTPLEKAQLGVLEVIKNVRRGTTT
ncbi:MAG: DHHA1 domain-containing protein [Sulfolobales archaeon]|nr:DHHA1 domain-containing protein [Sulfolobales archaeon]MCX8186086.1 DHHA1 domain-containing protein [Sulfolobales archaeon]MDW7969381.1 DHHA1 domain-containing protein [Sulfolobales archaeon]